jgi:Bacterial Ig-like domain (group 2)
MLSPSPQLSKLRITPQASSIALGQTVQFKAMEILDDGSTKDATNSVVWMSSNRDVASIDATGLATSLSTGAASVIASAGQVENSAAINVSNAAVVSITIDPSASSIALGATTQLKAIGTFTDLSTRDVTNIVTWGSSESDIVTISPTGLATSRSVGSASIAATSGAANASSTLMVLPAALASISVSQDHSTVPLGTTAQFRATGKFTDGSTQDLTGSVSWSSYPQGVVGVNSSGVATGLKTGTASVNAKSAAIIGVGTLMVSAAQLTSIAVTSGSPTMALGTTQQMTATGNYSDGSTRDLTSSVSWSSAPQGLVKISVSGVATGLKEGAASIHATSASVTGAGTLTVSAAQLASIAVTSGKVTMPLGTAQQLTAIGAYTDGSTRDLTNSVSWSTGSEKIVSISNSGIAEAKALGTTAISATALAINGRASITVSSPALTSIGISPLNPTVPLASSLQLAAIGTFTDGSTQDLTSAVVWGVGDDSIANVSSTGNATARHVGYTAAEAAFGGIQSSTTILVEPIAAVSYFTTGPSRIDTTLRATNPGADEPNLCAMVYVFDQDQQMAECCGCRISQDGLRTWSLNKDLIGNPLTGRVLITGSILLLTADYVSNPSCDSSSISPTGMSIAWATHLQTLPPNATTISEESLSEIPLNGTLTSALQAQCNFVQQLGGGQGICSCGTGH